MVLPDLLLTALSKNPSWI